MPNIRLLIGALLLAAPAWSSAAAQPPDTLTLATGADRSGRQRATGRVIDYAGPTLTWENAAGAQVEIASDRVVEIESIWNDAHRTANRLFASGQYEAALNQYAAAIGDEPRLWVRRLILSRAVWCCRNTNQQPRAARTFLALVASDAETPYLDCIPLAWTSTPADPALLSTVQSVMRLEAPPAAQLLAASWLLLGADGQWAAETLRRLATHDDRRIALLAETQLWRRSAGAAGEGGADRLGGICLRLPAELRAGPLMLWGDALAAERRHVEAALAYLRTPVLHPLAGDLASEAWYRAAQSLAAENRRDEAVLALRTLLAEHPDSLLAQAARTRLDALTQP